MSDETAREFTRSLIAALQSGDPEVLGSHFTDDAHLIDYRGEALFGRWEIQRAFARLPSSGLRASVELLRIQHIGSHVQTVLLTVGASYRERPIRTHLATLTLTDTRGDLQCAAAAAVRMSARWTTAYNPLVGMRL